MQKGTFYKPLCNLLIFYRLQMRKWRTWEWIIEDGQYFSVKIFVIAAELIGNILKHDEKKIPMHIFTMRMGMIFILWCVCYVVLLFDVGLLKTEVTLLVNDLQGKTNEEGDDTETC